MRNLGQILRVLQHDSRVAIIAVRERPYWAHGRDFERVVDVYLAPREPCVDEGLGGLIYSLGRRLEPTSREDFRRWPASGELSFGKLRFDEEVEGAIRHRTLVCLYPDAQIARAALAGKANRWGMHLSDLASYSPFRARLAAA